MKDLSFFLDKSFFTLRKFKNNLPFARKNAKITDIHSVLIIRIL
ncbi:hypothetical protein HMPREF0645_2248 [Hallella bergensis DSM 17361]|uniref:Uncharacterized protein n=1 Tax=Hallella bergensis DSM 17361 TaxID=585502 RepID=D1PZ63_9BACT|nr:hypothetical protein HMPREF0645_2248 [Hallella bergensis DSM 17361]